MISIIRSVREEAERELLLAQAKIDVTNQIEKMYLSKNVENAEEPVCECTENAEEQENVEFNTI